MSNASLIVALLVGLGGLAVIFNHLQARLGLVEVVLNEGLPPGYRAEEQLGPGGKEFDVAIARTALEPGLHVFVSRGCIACQRLLEELDARGLESAADVHLRFVDRPRPAVADLAAALGASLHDHELELTEAIGADPLPHTVAIGDRGLIAHRPTPTVADVIGTARDAGLTAGEAARSR